MRVGSLFSGYGGLDLAAMQLFPGSRVWWHVEYDAAPAAILAHHWPGVPNYGDVTAIDWSTVPPVDILTGGYPCQPFSMAGRRKGANDERHLWPYVRQAIRALRPRVALLENVAGHRSMGFDRVLGDLAEDGLNVRWTSLRASDVGAPHHRERLFVAVTTPDAGHDGREGRPERDREPSAGLEGSLGLDAHGCRDAAPDAGSEERARRTGLRADEAPEVGRARSRHGDNDSVQWGAYEPAIRRWERVTRPAPAPTEPNTKGKPRLAAPFAEWMMGIPAGWVTDPAIGISRPEQLKAIGNGVVPQQAVAAFGAIL
ncbi:DNA cytosine methyltransferase [Rhodococcus aetherivorans]|uniref:DNA cytosine methyltransferase n=1 Tax=Rhodococcus aetherivorans TaxID=191292 RepID=UPI0031D07EF4